MTKNNIKAHCLFLQFLLFALSATTWAKNDPVADSSMILRAAAISDIWSTGAVRLQMHLKFFAVKAGTIDAQFEEISDSSAYWRTNITSDEFNSSTFFSKDQVWELQDTPEKPIRIRQIERALAALSQSIVSDKLDFSRRKQKGNQYDHELLCVLATEGRRSVQDCFDEGTGTLRAVTEQSWTYLYSDYAPFKGKLFPHLITVYESSTLVAIAQVVGLESPALLDAGLFVPPSGSLQYAACREALGLPLGMGEAKLSKYVKPDSPRLPPNSGIISNDIVISGVVGRDGRLHNVSAHGANALTKTATLRVAQQWQFQPLKVCGSPVEVPVEVTINFDNAGRYVGCFGCGRE